MIHLEQQWEENRPTAEGRQLHERAHEQREEWREGVRISRGLAVRSLRLGVSGKVDVVEFHPQASGPPQPFPVEYKHGGPKPGRWDEVQLCAQALCLEEMLGVEVPRGAIFYGRPRRRMGVAFGASLQSETERLANRLHQLYAARTTPAAEYYPQKCDHCSMLNVCLPRIAGEQRSVQAFLKRAVTAALASSEEAS